MNSDTSTSSEAESDNMSEIQELATQAQGLSDSVSNWTVAGHWFAGVAAFATVLLFIASIVAFSKTSRLTQAQERLAAAKDRETKRELANSGERIARANESAESAKAEAAKANERAAKADEGLFAATLSIEDRRQENLKLQVQLEQEQIRRAKLVESVLWRNATIFLSDWWRKKEEENKKFAVLFNPDDPKFPELEPVKVSVVCVKEREPMWVAHSLALCANTSPLMRLTDLTFTDEELRPGIIIEREVGPSKQEDLRYEAADAIVAALKGNFVMAHTAPGDLPEHTLRILVGPSDRLTGPMIWRQTGSGETGPPNILPPPIGIRNEKGKTVEVHFPDPAESARPQEQKAE
jgi:hypothetical protein